MGIQLRDICDFINGGAWSEKEYVDSGVPVIKVSNLKNEGIQTHNLSHLSEIGAQKYERNLLRAKDVVIATVGSHPNLVNSAAGRSVIISKSFEGYLLNQNAVCVRTKEKTILDQGYLGYLTKTGRFKGFIQNRGKGAANQMRIPIGAIKDFDPSLPPLTTQRKINSILSTYDHLIENNLKRIQLLEEMARINYEDWFVRMRFPGHEDALINPETGLPEDWEVKKLKQIAKVNQKSLRKGFTGKIKYVDISSVSPGTIEGYSELNFEDAPGRARRVVTHKDIIWSCVRPNRRSHSVIWNPQENLIVSTGFAVITPVSIPTSYLLHFLTADSYVGYLTNMAGGAAYPAVKPIDFEDSDVVVPSLILLQEYDSIVLPILDLIDSLKKQIPLLKEARDILLPRLMTGMIDVDELEIPLAHEEPII